MHEIAQPCGRFRSLFDSRDRLRARIVETMHRFDRFRGAEAVLTTGMPLNWQLLLDELHRAKIIDTPSFSFPLARNDFPGTYSARVLPYEDESQTDGRKVEYTGYGSSASFEDAMSKSVGEILERHLLTLYRKAALTYGTPRDLSTMHSLLDIFSLNGFAPWQEESFPKFKRSIDSEFAWVEGSAYGTGSPTLLPAQLVYWSYRNELDSLEPTLYQSTTSGGAGHFTRTEAILSGVLELVERDGFFMHWLNSVPPHRIPNESIRDSETRAMIDRYERLGLTVHFLDITTNVEIPAVMCVLIDAREGEPALAVGGGSGFSEKDVYIGALSEANIALLRLVSAEPYIHDQSAPPFSDRSIGRNERLSLWKGARMLDAFSFFIRGTKRSSASVFKKTEHILSPEEQLSWVCTQLRRLGAGYELYTYDVEHPILMRLGYHVVRTIVPRLFPLYLVESYATLRSARLDEFRMLHHKAVDTLNPLPHPFP